MYQQIKQLLAEGETLAVATIVSTLGSTPREVGAKMIVTASGEILGTIGGGCGEAEVRRRAVEAIRSRKPEMVKVELLDDIESDSPAVCGGVLDAFIDTWGKDSGVAVRLAGELEEIARVGNAAVLASVLSVDGVADAAPGDKCLVRNGEVRCGDIRDAGLQAAILREAAVREEREDCLRTTLELSGGRKAEVFFEVMTAVRKVVIVGAGHLAIPLAAFTKILGFHTTVMDDRVVYANRERFPDADEVLVGDMAETLRGLEITPQTYIVLITRGHQFDEPCLREVIRSNARYIGMIGSRRRIKACFIRFRDEEGISEELLKRVHAPIGLDIQAESPEEIALAIAAELVKVRRGGGAGSLSESER
ncbi:MAG: XdhC family protein [Acidobacteriota bacterium]|jgi:xanthine dehydrogenase accessory factor|nr:XdhC family protein [Acidobacteriota bacterium]